MYNSPNKYHFRIFVLLLYMHFDYDNQKWEVKPT